MSGKSFFIVAIVVAVLVVVGYVLFSGKTGDQPQVTLSPELSATQTPLMSPSPIAVSSPSPVPSTAQGALKTVAVVGKSFTFDQKEIRVKKGDTVKIVFTNTEGLHDWVIDEFSARTPRIQAGETSTIQFVADKAGSFQYYCSVGSHRAQGMWGTLIVQ